MAAVLLKKTFSNVANDILSDSRSVDWFLLGYEEGSKNRIKLIAKGDGGLEAMAHHLNEGIVAFGYLKIKEENPDNQQTNPDFVHITFIGKEVKAQERARAVIHRLDVHQALPDFIVEYDANSLQDLRMDKIMEEVNDMKRQLDY